MRIAVIDDDAEDLSTAESYIRQHIHDRYVEEESFLVIDAFRSAEDMMKVFDVGLYDLMIFDICLENMSGLQAARWVRELDSEVSIVFLTSSDDYTLEGYGVFAVGYFIKPLSEHADEFAGTFAHIFPKVKERCKEIPIRAEGTSFSVPHRSIFYVDIDWRHRLRLHLADREINVAMNYANLQKLLQDDSRFLECHHRILVNMDKIVSMGKEEFILKNGDHVPISQRRQKESKAKYMHYLAHK